MWLSEWITDRWRRTFSISVPTPRSAARFAASAAGAKDRVARQGAHLSMRDDAGPGPWTLASAPQAPGRLGREDARNFGGGTLRLRKEGRDGEEAEQRRHVDDRIGEQAARPAAAAGQVKEGDAEQPAAQHRRAGE